jgi:hypothetical protein
MLLTKTKASNSKIWCATSHAFLEAVLLMVCELDRDVSGSRAIFSVDHGKWQARN